MAIYFVRPIKDVGSQKAEVKFCIRGMNKRVCPCLLEKAGIALWLTFFVDIGIIVMY
ncbi:MAG: hypothetical protein ACE5H1_00440 [Thermodesulfobacteriota bacterium]